MNLWTPIPPTWKLTFCEEFNGPSLDRNRWGWPDGTPDTTYPDYSNAIYDAKNIAFENSCAVLSVNKTANGYSTCSMTSNHRQTYGYWEARAKAPAAAAGIGAGFWTDAEGWTMPEIDILEWLSCTPTVNHMTWHYAEPDDGTNAWGVSHSVSNPQLDLSDDFHLYGMLWRPGLISWYFDGVLTAGTRYRVDEANAVAQQTIVNTTIGGWGMNWVDAATRFPTQYIVDYVHIYSDDPAAVAVEPDAGYRGPGAV